MGKHVLIGNDLDSHGVEALREAGLSGAISAMYVICEEDRNDAFSTGAILASLVIELTYRLAFVDPSIRSWADHLASLGIYGGIGRPIYWEEKVLSKAVKQRIIETGFETDHWSKWNGSLP